MALRLWLGFPKSLDISKAIDKKLGAERKTVGLKPYTNDGSIRGNSYNKGGYERVQLPITAPATDLAKKWDGWGTALKPAHEPIIVARKPFDGTVADNVERFGTGAINIGGCRIGDEEVRSSGEVSNAWREAEGRTDRQAPNPSVNKGRFPANCVTTEPDAFFSKYFNVTPPELCKKTSKRDRNSNWRGEIVGQNRHPTVKPTDLMAWLVRLITPPGGIVLDPFAGSGSTCVAARREGFFFIGIELNEEYCEIARRRVASHTAQQELKFA